MGPGRSRQSAISNLLSAAFGASKWVKVKVKVQVQVRKKRLKGEGVRPTLHGFSPPRRLLAKSFGVALAKAGFEES